MSFCHEELIPWQMWILEELGVFFCVIKESFFLAKDIVLAK